MGSLGSSSKPTAYRNGHCVAQISTTKRTTTSSLVDSGTQAKAELDWTPELLAAL